MSTPGIRLPRTERHQENSRLSHGDCLVTQVALELTEACNYRCGMCNYWRIPDPVMMPTAMATQFLGMFGPGRLESVLLTGGEPLLHTGWRDIAQAIPAGARRYLCTNGSPILRTNRDAAVLFDRITVSVDGATDETFERIRGYGHLTGILRALESMKRETPGLTIFLKMTIQRLNIHEVERMFELAAGLPFVDGVGFAIPDFSAAAFGFGKQPPAAGYQDQVVPDEEAIGRFERDVARIQERFAAAIARGFMYEGNLPRYVQRFKELRGVAVPPPLRGCVIPSYSLVLKANGSLAGCYFLPEIGSFEDLKRSGFRLHAQAVAGHDPRVNPVCRRCDQLMNRPE